MVFSEFKEILESDDPEIVRNAIEQWMKKEGPAMALMRGLKQAAQVYFVAIGRQDVDYSIAPEEFVYIYGSQLWPLPFFEAFQAPATLLSEYMVLLEPGRKSVLVASYGVMAKMGAPQVLKMDSIREEIAAHRDKGYPIPKISEGL